jgi:hypothetical protein
LWGWMLAPVLAAAAPGSFGAGPVGPAARDLLEVRDDGRGFSIVDGAGWRVSAVDAAWLFGDVRTYERATAVRRRQRNVGAFLVSIGPVFLIAGAVQVSEAQWRDAPYLEAVGYGGLLAGTFAAASGIGLIVDPRPGRASTYYTRDQAGKLVDAYNERIRASWGEPGAARTHPGVVEPVVGFSFRPGGGVAVAGFRW